GPDLHGHLDARLSGIDHHATVGLARGERAIGLAQLLMKLERFALEPVGTPFAAPFLGARKANFGWRVENEGEIGLELADGDLFEEIDQLQVHLAERALVNPGRVDEAVAD